jgi:hypothetical protein
VLKYDFLENLCAIFKNKYFVRIWENIDILYVISSV